MRNHVITKKSNSIRHCLPLASYCASQSISLKAKIKTIPMRTKHNEGRRCNIIGYISQENLLLDAVSCDEIIV